MFVKDTDPHPANMRAGLALSTKANDFMRSSSKVTDNKADQIRELNTPTTNLKWIKLDF